MFEQIKQKTKNFKLKYLIADFEEAPIAAFKEKLPNISINYCLFHFGQILYRKIYSTGLSSIYNANDEFKIDIKKLLTLSFVEISEVTKYFEEVKNYLFEKYKVFESGEYKITSGLCVLIEYFEKNFILETKKRKICEWNAVKRIENGIALTTNAAEGWNRFLNSSFREPHPSLLSLIKFIQTVQHNNETILDRIISFQQPQSVVKRKYKEKPEGLKVIIENKELLTPIQFLRAIALNYCWKLD
jgi:hypothetical protein